MRKESDINQPGLAKPTSNQRAANKAHALVEDKAWRKKLRNRQSALAARERKKARMLMLERTVRECQLEHKRLVDENLKYRKMIHLIRTKSFALGSVNVHQLDSPEKVFDHQICESESNHTMQTENTSRRCNSGEYISFELGASHQDAIQMPNYLSGRRNSCDVLMKSESEQASGQLNKRKVRLSCCSSSVTSKGSDDPMPKNLVSENISPPPPLTPTPEIMSELAESSGNKQSLSQLPSQPYHQLVRRVEEHYHASPETEIQVCYNDDVFSPDMPTNSMVERHGEIPHTKTLSVSKGTNGPHINCGEIDSQDSNVPYQPSWLNFSHLRNSDHEFDGIYQRYCYGWECTQTPSHSKELNRYHPSSMLPMILENGSNSQQGGSLKRYYGILQWLLDDNE